jgi:hypothetical protein
MVEVTPMLDAFEATSSRQPRAAVSGPVSKPRGDAMVQHRSNPLGIEEARPTHQRVQMRPDHHDRMQSPAAMPADLFGRSFNKAAQAVIEDHPLEPGSAGVTLGKLMVGTEDAFASPHKTTPVVGHPRPVSVKGKEIDGHDGLPLKDAQR